MTNCRKLMREIPNDYVRMQKCVQCGKDTGCILMSRRLKSIPEGQAYADINGGPAFCDECKKLFKTHHFFITRKECHQGFIKKSALKKMLGKNYEKYKNNKIIGFEFCPRCDGMIEDDKQL